MPEIGETGRQGYNKVIWQACSICGKERWVQVVKGKPTTTICHLCSITGSHGPGWKGGRRKTVMGYIEICLEPTDFFFPMTKANHCVSEHRLVMAKYLGRCLQLWEIVHHKNGIKDDNRLENLQIITDARHKQITILENKIKNLEVRVLNLEIENIFLRELFGVKN